MILVIEILPPSGGIFGRPPVMRPRRECYGNVGPGRRNFQAFYSFLIALLTFFRRRAYTKPRACAFPDVLFGLIQMLKSCH